MRAITLPPLVLQTAQARGSDGLRWVDQLPGLVADLADRWGLRVGATLAGGSAAYVAEAVTEAGTAVVLKLAMPGLELLEFEREIDTLVFAAGRGYPRVLHHDAAHSALLLDRLGAALADLQYSISDQIRIICSALHDAWLPISPAVVLPTCADKTVFLANFIQQLWAQQREPCRRGVIDQALAFCELRRHAFDPELAVLIHGDAHAGNTLRCPAATEAGEARFKLIDPDGLIGERACDLAVLMRGWNAALLAGDALALGRQRCALLSELTGENATAIWQWGCIERVSTGLLLLQVGREREGRATLRVAERWMPD